MKTGNIVFSLRLEGGAFSQNRQPRQKLFPTNLFIYFRALTGVYWLCTAAGSKSARHPRLALESVQV